LEAGRTGVKHRGKVSVWGDRLCEEPAMLAASRRRSVDLAESLSDGARPSDDNKLWIGN
jgi:hypothetical protein